MVCDFKIVKDVVGDWLETFDHALCMNTADPAYEEFTGRYGDRVIGFENQDPTTELMARTIFDHSPSGSSDYAAAPIAAIPSTAVSASSRSGSGKPPPRGRNTNH